MLTSILPSMPALQIFLSFHFRGGSGRHSNSDMSDSCCDLNSSMDEVPRPAPPQMFANNSTAADSCSDTVCTKSQLSTHSELAFLECDTYEDENGDPYSVV